MVENIQMWRERERVRKKNIVNDLREEAGRLHGKKLMMPKANETVAEIATAVATEKTYLLTKSSVKTY